MNAEQHRWFRLGVLTQLVESSTTRLGRTALMKLAYLLQTVRRVPLGYDFRLYTYGPYQSDVLNDLGRLETMQAVVSEVVPYPSGRARRARKSSRSRAMCFRTAGIPSTGLSPSSASVRPRIWNCSRQSYSRTGRLSTSVEQSPSTSSVESFARSSRASRRNSCRRRLRVWRRRGCCRPWTKQSRRFARAEVTPCDSRAPAVFSS